MASQSERIYVARSGTSATNSTPIALTAAATKSVVLALGAATDTICLKRWRISFNSVTGTDVPATVELGIITAGGTSTAFTPIQVNGSALAASSTAGYNCTAEPTYSRILDALYVPCNNGLYDFYYPLGEEPVAAVSQGFAVRVTTPQNQSCFCSLWYSE